MTTVDAEYGKPTKTIRQPIQHSESSGRCSGIGPKAFLRVGLALLRGMSFATFSSSFSRRDLDMKSSSLFMDDMEGNGSQLRTLRGIQDSDIHLEAHGYKNTQLNTLPHILECYNPRTPQLCNR